MTFRELLEKYKNQTATPEERKRVEAELEKYNALTEYLLEQDVDMEGEDLAGQQEELQKIDRSMKKRGRRIIAIAVVIACVVMGALTAFQPVISKVIWYDPTERDFQQYSYDISCHLAVLAELTMPEVQMESVMITEKGWGQYDLQVQQREWSSGEYLWEDGTVTRGKIQLKSNVYQYSVINAFSRGTAEFGNSVMTESAEAKAALADLPEYMQMEAYVSLGKDWTMEELENFAAQQDGYLGWVGVRTSPEDQQFLPLMGFDADSSGYIWDHVDEAYPFYELSMHEDVPLAEAWEKHFLALLQYSIDHGDFYARLNQSNDHGSTCQMVQEYVTENGVKTYGFLYYGTPAEMRKLLENEDVEGIYVTDYQLRVPGL
ncbi:anti-sigma factor C-terminal domain-containing protein [Anaerotignum lactatifermentans]|uniref:anti-sigma factor C-terminal domain-containing protein n=1 Tax=Anaerotignum lactatifermentans TaxID=160404 RepID=UPI0024301B36|nr:anti-sigma factor C-terminal domain-containing protein [Anaerotignum lactatifermentans]